jgi:hypothetical protein
MAQEKLDKLERSPVEPKLSSNYLHKVGELQSKENLGDEDLAVHEWGDLSDFALDKWNLLESWKMF